MHAKVKLVYSSRSGIDSFVREVAAANPVQLAEAERRGVAGVFIRDLAQRIDLPATRVSQMLGVPRATAASKSRPGEVLGGSGGQAAIGMAKLLARAQAIVAASTASQAKGFDVARWLGKWVDIAQPSLGGRKPADLLDTPSGQEAVMRLLGAFESGAYQ